MKTFRTGFIGCGNMASAIIHGILRNNILEPGDLYLYDKDRQRAESFSGANVCASVSETARCADLLFLCVKPNVVPEVLAEIDAPGRAVISIAAGVKSEKIKSYLNVDTRVMRIMPNTPLLVGRGAIGVEAPDSLRQDERDFVFRVFKALGMAREVGEDLMDAVTGVSGSGPAYVYLFVDALAKAGEANGLPYDTAFALAVQTFEGACAMLKDCGGKTPEDLIRAVCSPGGTTLEAMKVYEERDICGTIREAVDACVRRSKELSE